MVYLEEKILKKARQISQAKSRIQCSQSLLTLGFQPQTAAYECPGQHQTATLKMGSKKPCSWQPELQKASSTGSTKPNFCFFVLILTTQFFQFQFSHFLFNTKYINSYLEFMKSVCVTKNSLHTSITFIKVAKYETCLKRVISYVTNLNLLFLVFHLRKPKLKRN